MTEGAFTVMIDGMEVTKEWYNYPPFEEVLQMLHDAPEAKWRREFTRAELKDFINSGALGAKFVATYSPESGKVEDILQDYLDQGKTWIDVQNLCYHYSWQNPKGNYRSHKQMLEYIDGRGDSSRYRLLGGDS